MRGARAAFRPAGRRRCHDLCGQCAQPRAADRRAQHRLRQGRHQRRGADAAACSTSTVHPRRASGRGVPRRSLDRRSRSFLQTNVLGTFTLLKAALDAWRPPEHWIAAAFCMCRPMRSTARSGSTDPAFTETRSTGRTRPTPRARPPAIIWCAPSSRPRHAGADHQLLEQLRSLSASRKTDSADDHSRAGRKAAADLWRRLQCARLAARLRIIATR